MYLCDKAIHASRRGDKAFNQVLAGFPVIQAERKAASCRKYARVRLLQTGAVKAGVIAEDCDGRFDFHNFRHSLASYLVRSKTDPKTVQALLRHFDVKTTLQLYSHSASEDRMAAQGDMLQAILGSATDEAGLRAD